MTDEVIAEIDRALTAHEPIKVRADAVDRFGNETPWRNALTEGQFMRCPQCLNHLPRTVENSHRDDREPNKREAPAR